MKTSTKHSPAWTILKNKLSAAKWRTIRSEKDGSLVWEFQSPFSEEEKDILINEGFVFHGFSYQGGWSETLHAP